MTFGEFYAVLRGVALRNGHPVSAAPDEDEFFEALRLSYEDGTA